MALQERRATDALRETQDDLESLRAKADAAMAGPRGPGRPVAWSTHLAQAEAEVADAREVLVEAQTQREEIHTPGHTPGSVCFRCRAEGKEILFSGDTLFAGSVGRTDLWGGDHDLLVKSIRGRLVTVPEETVVITGHDRPTTIARERRGNPFVRP